MNQSTTDQSESYVISENPLVIKVPVDAWLEMPWSPVIHILHGSDEATLKFSGNVKIQVDRDNTTSSTRDIEFNCDYYTVENIEAYVDKATAHLEPPILRDNIRIAVKAALLTYKVKHDYRDQTVNHYLSEVIKAMADFSLIFNPALAEIVKKSDFDWYQTVRKTFFDFVKEAEGANCEDEK